MGELAHNDLADSIGERFPKSARLRRRADFLRVQGSGDHFNTRLFALRFQASPAKTTRLGITTSRKFGPSVQRNRFKRCMREAFRRNLSRLPEGIDLVIIARRAAQDVDYSALETELVRWSDWWHRKNRA